jgi:serine protease Do
VRRTFEVRLQPAPSEAVATRDTGDDDPSKPATVAGKLGIQVQPLPPEWSRRAGLSDNEQGVVVTNVEAGGPAWNRLLSASQASAPDVILAVDQQRVRSVAEFQDAMRAVRAGEVVELRVLNLAQGAGERIVRVRARR